MSKQNATRHEKHSCTKNDSPLDSTVSGQMENTNLSFNNHKSSSVTNDDVMDQKASDCEAKSEFQDCLTKTETQIESRVEANSETDGLIAFGFCDKKLVLKKNLKVHM